MISWFPLLLYRRVVAGLFVVIAAGALAKITLAVSTGGAASAAYYYYTAVSITSSSAERTRAGINVRWRTGSEGNVLGFNVYREQNGVRVKANRRLIRSVVAGTLSGHAYSWIDRSASKVRRYWIDQVLFSGDRRWHGPIRVR